MTFSYREGTHPQPTSDIVGFDVEARDGHIGKIDEATYEPGMSCLVVDTGFWIFEKQRMLPAGVVERIDHDRKLVHVSMTKDEIKALPDYDEAQHRADEAAYHQEIENYFDPLAGTGTADFDPVTELPVKPA